MGSYLVQIIVFTTRVTTDISDLPTACGHIPVDEINYSLGSLVRQTSYSLASLVRQINYSLVSLIRQINFSLAFLVRQICVTN